MHLSLRCTWVYLLKFKYEVFDMFVTYKALVEKQSRHQLQRLRTYKEGEYVNKKFTAYCTTQGIQMQHIVPYTQQQNGVTSNSNASFLLLLCHLCKSFKPNPSCF
jgi:hypothetical protein